MAAGDYVGMVSGNTTPDKVKKTGWTVRPASAVNAPVFEELPMTMECRLTSETANGNLIADIVAITCDDACLDAAGRPDLGKMGLITFDSTNNTYRMVGDVVAGAWEAGKAIK